MVYRKGFLKITASFTNLIILSFVFSYANCQQCIVPYQCEEMLLTFEQAVALSSNTGGIGGGAPTMNKKQHLDLTWGQCRGMVQSGVYNSAVYCRDSQFCGGDITADLLADTGTKFEDPFGHSIVTIDRLKHSIVLHQ